MSDGAPEFVGSILTALCDILHVKKLRTSPYHPQSNGAVERTHQTLMRMIGKLDPNHKHRWPDHIGSICHAYNTMRSQVTGYSPHFLMFGHRPCLPIDLLFLTVQRATIKGVDSYVTALYDHLHLAIGKVKATAEKEARRFKRIYDQRAGAIVLHPGDKVLIHLDSFVGQRRKLKNRWGSQIHTVVRCVADGVPTYVVRNNHSGGEQVLHWACLLLWIGDCTNRDDGVSIEYYYRGEASVQFNVTTVNSSHSHFVSVLFSQCQQLAKLKQCKISGCFRFCLFLKPILNRFTHMTHQIEAQNLLYKIGMFL